MACEVLVEMDGLRFGRLAFSSRGPHGHAHRHLSCRARVTAEGSEARSGDTTSCRHREISAARLTVHGHRAAKRHGLTYRAWQAMKDRCADPASPTFEAVGARGVAVCPA